MARLREEVDTVVARHRTSPSQSLTDVLGALTIEEWEGEFPLIDLALRETIRFCLPGATFRKNMTGRDVPIGESGEVIPDGAFAIYLVEDSMFGDWYTDKMKWNPSRYFEENAEDKKVPHAYMGWGSGRHPCRKWRNISLFLPLYDFHLYNAPRHYPARPSRSTDSGPMLEPQLPNPLSTKMTYMC